MIEFSEEEKQKFESSKIGIYREISQIKEQISLYNEFKEKIPALSDEFNKTITKLQEQLIKNENMIKKYYTYKSLPLYNINYIIGPHYYKLFQINFPDGLYNYHIFGEEHIGLLDSDNDNSVYMNVFLNSLFSQNSDKIFDLFIEKPQVLSLSNSILNTNQKKRLSLPNVTTHSNSMLDILAINFSDCITTPRKVTCSGNLRIHRVDIRENPTISQIIDKYNPNNSQGITDITQKDISDIKTIKSFIMLLQNEKYIEKQLNIKNNELDALDIFNKIGIKINAYIDLLQNIESNLANNVSITSDVLFSIFSSILSLYTIIRMFRKFEKPKNGNTITGAVKNFIFYGGSYHSEQISLFFENNLKLKSIEQINTKIDENPSRIIQMPNIFISDVYQENIDLQTDGSIKSSKLKTKLSTRKHKRKSKHKSKK